MFTLYHSSCFSANEAYPGNLGKAHAEATGNVHNLTWADIMNMPGSLGNPINIDNGDLNDVKQSGYYVHTASWPPSNAPQTGAGYVEVKRGSGSDYVMQTWEHRDVNGIVWARRWDGATWGSWVQRSG